MIVPHTLPQTAMWFQERDQLHAILDATDVMLVYLDPEFNFVIVNKAYAETCRMRPQEMIGKNHFALYPNPENEAIFRRVRDTGETVFFKDKPFEFPDQPGRGVTYWDWSLAPVKDQTGQVKGLVFSLRETTESKKIELALRVSEERSRTILQAAQDGFVVVDRNGLLLDTNETYCAMSGYSRAELLTMTIPQIEAVQTEEEVLARAAKILAHEHARFETRHRRRDGSTFAVEVSAHEVSGRDGEIFALFRDISERKKNEFIIGEQKQMLEDITQGISEGILLLSKDYRILWANKAVMRQTGLPVDVLIGNHCYKATHNLDFRCAPPSDPCPVHDLLNNGGERPNTVEHVHQGRNGERIFVEVSAYPIKDSNGEVVKFVHITKDITERKRSEKELEDKAAQILRQNSELLEINSELNVLYTISKSLSRTIAIDELFSDILKTLMGIKIFQFQKAIIFLVAGDTMSVASHIGIDTAWIESHKNMMTGECLCGLAARTGEVIISTNSDTDARHTIRDRHTPVHGHIIVPLKNEDKVVGVLCLYLKPDLEIEEKHVNLLVSVATQMGLATKNARLYEETRALSLHDPLTALANRRYMEIVFDQIIAKSKRYKGLFSVIMLDIDYFKQYNDTHGHSAGDELLRQIALLLLDAVREIDLVVRYGGEEFLLLLHDADAKEAYETAERIRKLVGDKTRVTVSLGVSSYCTGTLNQQEIIDKADKALYLAKYNGRNRVETTG